MCIPSTRRNYTLFYCPRGRPVSMPNFRFIVHVIYLFLHGCGLHYNVLSGLSVKQELKGLMTNYYNCALPRKKTSLLANI